MNDNDVSDDRPDSVLVVENEVLVRRAISEYLRHCGYRVIEAASAEEAMTLLAQANIAVDVVFSAVELGGGDGRLCPGAMGADRAAEAQCHPDRHHRKGGAGGGRPLRGRAASQEALRTAECG